MEMLFFIAALIFLTFWSGFFSGSEIALFSLPSTKIKAYKTDKDPRRNLIAKLVLRPRDLLVTVFMLNTLVNILLQNVASGMFGMASSWSLRVGVPLFITLILGEIIPKYIAMQQNVRLSYFVAPLIDFFTRLIGPVRRLTIKITDPVSRIMFFYLKKEKTISREELQHALKESQESGVLHRDEAELIKGYLDLQDAQVKEVMRPREDVIYYDINEPLNKLSHRFVVKECTRVPICNKTLDDVLGILTANTFFIHKNHIAQPKDVLEYIEKPYFVPETIPARLLLRRLHEQHLELALAVDEYGSVSGLISREDLVEEVVGEIIDRRDATPLYTRSSDDVIIASGKLELSDFAEIFGIPLQSEHNVVTIGGWLTEQLGDIPKTGARFETNDFLFQVLSSEPNRVKRLYIRKQKKRGA